MTLIDDPLVASTVGKVLLDEALETGSEKLISLCPCCELQLRITAERKRIPVEIVDLARFSASALGYHFPDPNPEVRRQWAVFEAMVKLMTPEGFAGLMGTMWPELLGIMPFGMGKMMRFMGKIPGAPRLMKTIFPVLLPRLIPDMMPELMPVMLDRIGERIPMPDYMREQMPDLMPQVIDNLIPHMIEALTPLITEPLMCYLKGKETKDNCKGKRYMPKNL